MTTSFDLSDLHPEARAYLVAHARRERQAAPRLYDALAAALGDDGVRLDLDLASWTPDELLAGVAEAVSLKMAFSAGGAAKGMHLASGALRVLDEILAALQAEARRRTAAGPGGQN